VNKKATAPQMRKCLEMVEVFKKGGLRFVPMPVRGEEEFKMRCEEVGEILESMIGTAAEGEL
jgi:hypothetical protein